MSVHTVLLDFSLNPTEIKSDSQLSVISTNLENILRDYLSNLKLLSSHNLDGNNLKIYSSDFGAVTNIRIFNHGLITINIEYYKGDKQEPLITLERTKQLGSDVRARVLGVGRSQYYPAIRRCEPRYFLTSDQRLFEYDIDAVVFEERSSYQKIQILHSKSMGNILILDDFQNISEADLIYTETLMVRGAEDYKDKEIVILGGGDGALLYELLKENPKHVTMLEIDEMVMKACAKHMRSICGDVLDRYNSPNYQIIVGDCMKSLDLFEKEGRKFDFIFGDLTDIPINESETGEMWNFIWKLLEKSFKLLKPDGKYLTHANGITCTESLNKFETLLEKIEPVVNFTKSTAFVPSFLEDWVFYQVSFSKKD